MGTPIALAPRAAGAHTGRWIAAGLLATLMLGMALGEATGWPVLRNAVQQQASRAAQVPVQFRGRFHLSLLGKPQLEVGQLTVGAAQGLKAPHLLQAEDALLAWRWGDLWRWRQGEPLHIRALTSKTLNLRLLRLADGRASWALGRSPSTPDTRAEWPRLGRLQVDTGHVVVDDALLDTALKVELTGGEGDAAGSGAAGYRADIRGRWHALPLQLAVRMGGALPLLHDEADDDGGAAPPAVPLRVEGTAGAARVLFDGRAAALLGARQLEGAALFGLSD